jgi:soluble lytic murein transglycosylase-like protein
MSGAGCISGFAIPPLVVLLVAGLLASVAFSASPSDVASPAPATPQQQLSPIFTAQVQFWRSSILSWAASSDLHPNLVAVIMQIESCGDPFALSRAGAIGLFQVMPDHFLANEDAYSPDINAERGLAYLKRALAAADNDVRLALAGYNGGLSLISLPESSWPAETVRYAHWGSTIYADAYGGAFPSSGISSWLSAGGASLCRQAAQRLQIAD